MAFEDLLEKISKRGQLVAAEEQASESRNKFENRLDAYDPREYMREAAEGIFADLEDQYLGLMGRFRSGLNARGIRSDLGGAGLRRNFGRTLADRLSALSMQAGGMEMEKIGGYGGLYGQDLINLAGIRDMITARDNARRQERSNMMGGIMSAGGTIAGAAILASDERLKTEIEDIDGALEKLRSARGIEWDWNEDGEAVTGRRGHDSGVSAQSVERTMPEHVIRGEDGVRRVNYGHPNTGLVGTLMEGVKELDSKIQELEQRLGGRAA